MPQETQETQELRLQQSLDDAKRSLKRGQFRDLVSKLANVISHESFSVKMREAFSSAPREEDRRNLEELREVYRAVLLIYQVIDYYAWSSLKPIARNSRSDFTLTARGLNRLFEFKLQHPIDKVGGIVWKWLQKTFDPKEQESWSNTVLTECWIEIIWLAIIQCENRFHNGEIEEAIEDLSFIEDLVARSFVSEEDPRNATQAYIHENLGRFNRRLGRYGVADTEYYMAVRFYTLKSRTYKIKNSGQSGRSTARLREDDQAQIDDTRTYMFRRVAQIYAHGLGGSHSARSDLERSRGYLDIAELLLSGRPNDDLTLLYIELAKLVIRRIRAGKKATDELKSVLVDLSDIEAKFRDRGSNKFIMKSKWEQAIVLHLIDDSKQALALLEEIELHYKPSSTEYGGRRALANIYTLRSHIYRSLNLLDDATTSALTAIETEELAKNVIVWMDSRIALAEALFALDQSGVRARDRDKRVRKKDALAVYLDVYRRNNQNENKKIEAVCLLGMCRILAFRRKRRDANQRYSEYRAIKEKVRHQFVFDVLEAEAAALMKQLGRAFIIKELESAQPGDYDFENHTVDLKKWLLGAAIDASDGNNRRTADLLNIDPETLRLWRAGKFTNASRNRVTRKRKKE